MITDPKTINWSDLGFEYIQTPYRFEARYKDGAWEPGTLTEDPNISMNEGSPILHYGQGAFEGLKAYRTKDGRIQLFRPDQNAKRLQHSSDRLLMPEYPVDDFVKAVKQVVAANADYVPPYGTGATLYIRPMLIGVGENIGVHPAPEYILRIFVTPVGPYFKGGLTPTSFLVVNYDRAAHNGTGQSKVGGNYAASLLAGQEAHEHHYSDAIYLDPVHHRYIEEVGSANFLAFTKDGKTLKTPKSPSILPSITKYSSLYLAEHVLGMQTEETKISIDELDEFGEAAACGTAAVISPIAGIKNGDHYHVFYDEKKVGPITHKLYDLLTGIQFGDVEAPKGWIQQVEV